MLSAIHARPASSQPSTASVEPSSPTIVKFSDASKRVMSSRLFVERSASTTRTGTSLTSVVAA
jgi:hypothetical protein